VAENRDKVIVYIEDEVELVDLLRLIFKEESIVIESAVKGREGLDLIRQLKPDLVILDLMLPDMEGWTVYEEMQRDASIKNIPIVVITVRTEGSLEGVWPQTRQLAGYLVKPFRIQELREVVNQALGFSRDDWRSQPSKIV
jgi:DNA-binding response OmpR family regulator